MKHFNPYRIQWIECSVLIPVVVGKVLTEEKIHHANYSKRIKVKGYSDGLPLVSNDDEEERRQLNRKTAFKIIK